MTAGKERAAELRNMVPKKIRMEENRFTLILKTAISKKNKTNQKRKNNRYHYTPSHNPSSKGTPTPSRTAILNTLHHELDSNQCK